MLGDSVVGVKHCMDPRGGAVTRTTVALAAGGLACLLASAAAFYISIDTAARNAAALERHTHTLHKPVYAFRPRAVGAPLSAVAFGGLALGLAASVTALVRARAERRSPYYRIGTAPGVEQPVEGAPSESFPLVAPSGDDFVLNYGAGIEGELILDEQTTPLAELAATGRARPSATVAGAVEIPIPSAAKLRVRAGQTTFLVSAVARPAEEMPPPPLAMLEGRPLTYAAGSLVAHLGLVFVLSQVPRDPVMPGPLPPAFEELAFIATIEVVYEPPPEVPEDTATPAPAPKLSVAQCLLSAKDKLEEARAAREKALQEALNAVPCGLSLLPGRSGGCGGLDDPGRPAFGGVRSDGDIISTEGSITWDGTFGPRGYGPGGTGTLLMREHLAPALRYSSPAEVCGGGLDKATIKRHVKRSEARIRDCYEQALLARPGIEGSVTIEFVIAAGGSVRSASGEGFDPAVASCIANVIKTIRFPASNDGLPVGVSYPFTFRAAGP